MLAPFFGYYGVVDERLDYELIEALADAHQAGSVVLVGPMIKVDPDRLPRRRNLHYLGQRPYALLPAYLKGFDVCLMPWALNEATRTISPTKTLEYMAGSKPIVSTAVHDVVRDHGDIVFVARNAAEFIELALSATDRFDAGRAEAGRRQRQGTRLGRHRRGHAEADRGTAHQAESQPSSPGQDANGPRRPRRVQETLS